ncbi:LysR family transcriptional regulator [Achromobacter sp. Marseille-Q0513]|uniref:LysR family transcriptional regulator n=1 Tax=Achromobacter sp. Marseille-Q0513 TaxID=2829161 RepID=UPI001B99F5AE|nr:LysR family transcriptional regulator [Achromobacter sp. Marseille-Q0513]MBR8656305.1 LysR family transcriptional regulator [Achromobacter sp. Marseille-Q0513]
MNAQVLQEMAVRYFLEVARCGSVSIAAERLDVAPSAVSRQIARLERELGTLLFERRARGMMLNAAGELLAAHAKRAHQDMERVAGEIAGLRGLRQGLVRIACTEGFAHDFVPGAIAAFHAQHAGIRYTVDVCSQREVPQRVRDGTVDIGITLSLVSHRDVRVEWRMAAPVRAVVAAGHPLARQAELSLAQLMAYPLAVPHAESTLRHLIDISCSRQQLQFEPVFSSGSVNALVAFAAAGGGVAFCGELAIRHRLRWSQVAAVPLRDREMNERHFEVQTLAGRVLPEAVKAFVASLRQRLEADTAWEGADQASV